MKKLYFMLITGAICLVACNQFSKTAGTTKEDSLHESMDMPKDENILADGHNAENSLDYIGTYHGILPCASCEGIETEINLHRDSTYVIKTTYLGKEGQSFEEEGDFTISSGNILTLEGITDASNKYFIGENYLKHLDMQNNEITGPLADKYILKKRM